LIDTGPLSPPEKASSPGAIFLGNGIEVVPANWLDVKDLHELEKVCFQLDAWPLLDVLGMLTLPQLIRLKAVQQEKMVGFVGVDLRRTQATAWIATLAIDPEYRRMGIATALLGICEQRVDLPRMRLSVRQSNHPAISLYKKLGYQQVDLWRSYYKGGDNALVFEKTLPNR
jgi:ribosomal-protein-alanine N-acetyltransferase